MIAAATVVVAVSIIIVMIIDINVRMDFDDGTTIIVSTDRSPLPSLVFARHGQKNNGHPRSRVEVGGLFD